LIYIEDGSLASRYGFFYRDKDLLESVLKLIKSKVQDESYRYIKIKELKAKINSTEMNEKVDKFV